ncbi:MAG: alpha/beta hydrolase [Chloroflexota bacterium]
MSNWQSATIESNELTLHYTRTGGDKPPLVLCHGFSDDGLCWTPVAKVLSADYDIIMLDARGHGRSEGPEEGYGSLEHAADVAGVIIGLGLEKPVILGHSMGAATALVLAGTYPNLAGAILLEDPPAWWINPPVDMNPSSRRQRFGGWIVELKRKTAEEMIALCRAQSPTWHEAELGPWAESKLRLSFNVLTSEQSETVDWRTIIGKITCPALLITADPVQGALVTAEQATVFHELVPQIQVKNIARAGHNIRREQFAAFMDVVQGFLAAHHPSA